MNLVKPWPLTSGLQALLGGFIMAYTGVLLSATAIPLWGKGKYHIPAMSVASALGGACALNSIALSLDRNGTSARHKLEKLEICCALVELAVLLHFRSYAGSTGKPMFEGDRGERLQTWTIGAGIIGPVVLNLPSVLSRRNKKRPSLLRTLAAGALTLAGGYILRETLIEAGKASADDPVQAFVQPK
jgi:formate-dependent nitrite reductase membrane component NrfD